MDVVTAGEIMIPLDDYPHIPYWFTVRQAIAEIQHSELLTGKQRTLPRAVLVFDEEYRLLGMVRRRDIMVAIEPEQVLHVNPDHPDKLFDVDVDADLLEMSYDKLANAVYNQGEKPVGSIMIPIEHTVNHDDHLIKIIFEMNKYQHSMIPVVKDDAVVGVIRTIEIINQISKMLNIS